MSAIFKVPLLLALSGTVLVIARSPNPPVEGEERTRFNSAHSDAGVKTQTVATKWVPRIFRAFIWTTYALETSAIVVSEYPELVQYLPEAAVKYLVVDGIHISRAFLTGAALMSAGTLLRAVANRYMGKYYTFELALRNDHKLVTGGPYAYVRHPGYTANFLYTPALVLTQLGAGSWWQAAGLWNTRAGRIVGGAWIALQGLTMLLQIHRIMQEDKVLKAEFKDQWVRWAQRTPYRLIPFIY